MLKPSHASRELHGVSAELQHLSEFPAASATVEVAPSDGLPTSAPQSMRARARRKLSPTRTMPASRAPSKRRKKAIRGMSPKNALSSPAAPRSKPAERARRIVPPKSALPDLPALILEMRTLHRMRQDYQNVEQGIANRLGAIKRRLMKSKTKANAASRAVITWHEQEVARAKEQRLGPETAMRDLARQFPVFESFVKPTCGFGEIGLAMIVGEAGDLANYANPDKLKRRMGLAPFNGRAGSTWARCGGLKKSEWTVFGYSRRRRSVMFVIVDSLLKHKAKNRYGELYRAWAAHELAKAKTAGLKVRAGKKGDPNDDIAHGFITKKHIQRRVERRIAQQLLIDLWRAWMGQGCHGARSMIAPLLAADPFPQPASEEAGA